MAQGGVTHTSRNAAWSLSVLMTVSSRKSNSMLDMPPRNIDCVEQIEQQYVRHAPRNIIDKIGMSKKHDNKEMNHESALQKTKPSPVWCLVFGKTNNISPNCMRLLHDTSPQHRSAQIKPNIFNRIKIKEQLKKIRMSECCQLENTCRTIKQMMDMEQVPFLCYK